MLSYISNCFNGILFQFVCHVGIYFFSRYGLAVALQNTTDFPCCLPQQKYYFFLINAAFKYGLRIIRLYAL